MNFNDIVNLIWSIQEPYRWYIIFGIGSIVTALLSRLVFKTLKWFFILLATSLIALAAWKLWLTL